MACSYSNYRDITAIDFYADGSVGFGLPLQVYARTVTLGEEGQCRLPSAPSFSASIDDMSGSLKEESTQSVPGMTMTVTVEYDVRWTSGSAQQERYASQQDMLTHGSYHMLITYIDGSRMFVRTIPEAFTVKISTSSGTTHVSITAGNVSGAQRVVRL